MNIRRQLEDLHDRLLMARRRHLGAERRAVAREMTASDDPSASRMAARLVATAPEIRAIRWKPSASFVGIFASTGDDDLFESLGLL